MQLLIVEPEIPPFPPSWLTNNPDQWLSRLRGKSLGKHLSHWGKAGLGERCQEEGSSKGVSRIKNSLSLWSWISPIKQSSHSEIGTTPCLEDKTQTQTIVLLPSSQQLYDGLEKVTLLITGSKTPSRTKGHSCGYIECCQAGNSK